MRNILALTRRVLQQFSHDPRTVAMFIVGPFLILWLFSVILGNSEYRPTVAAVGLPDSVVEALQEQNADVQEYAAGDLEDAEALLAAQELDAVLTLSDGALDMLVEGTDSNKTSATAKVVQTAVRESLSAERDGLQLELEEAFAQMEEAIEELADALEQQTRMIEQQQRADAELFGSMAANPDTAYLFQDGMPLAGKAPMEAEAEEAGAEGVGAGAGGDSSRSASSKSAQAGSSKSAAGLDIDLDGIEQPEFEPTVTEVTTSYLHGSSDWGLFDFTGPVFIAIYIFVFVFLTSGMSLVTERTGGTMERLLATPIKSWQLVAGYALGFGAVASVQTVIVLWACTALIGFPCIGSFAVVVLVAVITALASMTLGLLVSGLARSGLQVMQLMILFVVPQILLSGIFDLSQAPEWLQALSLCMPIEHAAAALRAVMLRGADLAAVANELYILCGFVAAFFIAASLSFSRRRSR